MKINNRSNGENYNVAVLDLEKVKTKDASNGENLLEVPKDGRLDFPPRPKYQEMSSVIIEPTIPVNIGTEENSRILHLATYLSTQE